MSTLMLKPSDTFSYTVEVTEPTEEFNTVGPPFDLAGCTVWFTVKRRPWSTTTAAYCYWVDGGAQLGISVDDPSTGECAIELTPAQTAEFDQAAHVWDFQIKTPDGKVRTIDGGTLVVLPAVNDRIVAP